MSYFLCAATSFFLFSILIPAFLTNCASAQDLEVLWVTAAPTEGQPGDTVSLQARLRNNGPGMAFVIPVQWFLSGDASISTGDMSLGESETLPDYLYAGGELTISKDVQLPVFQDSDPPSYLGIMIDPYGFLFGDNPANNAGSAPFTFMGDPLPGFFDTSGDNFLDLTHVGVAMQGGNVVVELTFMTQPDTVNGLLIMDLDQEPSTGFAGTGVPGAEAVASFLFHEMGGSSLTLYAESGTTTLGTIQRTGNTVRIQIPLSLIQGDTAMDLSLAADSAIGPTADFDRAPDVGAFATDTGTVVVRRPGDQGITVSLTDPVTGAGEPDFPDLKGMNTRVIGDQIEIVLDFDHQVEGLGQIPGSDGLFVWIDIDADKRLATGFKNTGENQPSFGVDYSIRLQIDPLAGTVYELLQEKKGTGEEEVKAVGLPFNDIFVRLADDQIICRVPLGYLGSGDGGGAIKITALNTREILSGTLDHIPASGAWDLKAGTAMAEQTCLIPAVYVSDPADDSVGAFGYDNDELLGFNACTGNSALLFRIDYKSYALSNDGATLIHLDTDRNPATGWQITNFAGDTIMGADYIIRSYWNTDDLLQITHVSRCQPPEETYLKNQLVTPTLVNRLYATIPLESIGNPPGSVDVLVRTASWAGWFLLPNDESPNSGVITLPTGLHRSDLDSDGDVDGQDLAMFVQQLAGGINTITPAEFAAEYGKTGGA